MGNPTILRAISQPHQYAAEETVVIKGPRGELKGVRLVGPLRTETQVELALSDCRILGISPRFAVSGELESSAGGVTLEGPQGSIALERGVIVPLPHLHLNPSDAKEAGLKHLDRVTVRIKAEREISLHSVVIRSRERVDSNALHLDTDQANAVGPIEQAHIVSITKE